MTRPDAAISNDPLAALDKVRWDLAPDCYRDTEQVPMLLRLLRQGERMAGQLPDRLAMLSPVGDHLSPATAEALPFLIQLAQHRDTRDRVAVVALLIRIARTTDEGPATLYGQDMVQVGRACRRALRGDIDGWFDLLGHPDRPFRRHVLALLALLSRLHGGTGIYSRRWDALFNSDSREQFAERVVSIAYEGAWEARSDDLERQWESWLLGGGAIEDEVVRTAWDHAKVPYWIDDDDVTTARVLMESQG
ncbi:hypothetical protein [Streptomyces milbemycinicus]|uniref:hypothetical protein n=1 Tax=Streptomyces milbemycinicus TaxID=476552 RepID=UPI0033DD705A